MHNDDYFVHDYNVLLKTNDSVLVEINFKNTIFFESFYSKCNILLPLRINNSHKKRVKEYFFGRLAAKNAMTILISKSDQITTGPSREPIFPFNLAGSITHSDTKAICYLSKQEDQHNAYHSDNPCSRQVCLGVDIETIINADKANKLENSVLKLEETRLNTLFEFKHFFTLIYSAKETLFKCLFPVCKQYFDFLDAELIEMDSQSHSLTFELRRDIGYLLKRSMRFKVNYHFSEDDVLTWMRVNDFEGLTAKGLLDFAANVAQDQLQTEQVLSAEY